MKNLKFKFFSLSDSSKIAEPTNFKSKTFGVPSYQMDDCACNQDSFLVKSEYSNPMNSLMKFNQNKLCKRADGKYPDDRIC